MNEITKIATTGATGLVATTGTAIAAETQAITLTDMSTAIVQVVIGLLTIIGMLRAKKVSK